MKRLLPVLFLLLFVAGPRGAARAQARGNPLQLLLARGDTAGLGRVLARPEFYRLQLLCTRIRRDARGRPHFRRYSYRLRPREYFYPASAVKLAAAALALQKRHDYNRQHPAAPLGLDSPMLTDSAFAGQTRAWRDTSSASGRPTLATYVRKALLVSDNDAYNRLYEYVGPETLNRELRRLGLRCSRLVHRLSVGDRPPGSRHTNPVRFFADTACTQLLFAQPAAYWADSLPRWRGPRRELLVGRGVLENGQVRLQPFDFGEKNVFPLADLQRLLQLVLFPEAAPARHRLRLDSADYRLLREALSAYPRQSLHPRYSPREFPDTYAKFLLGGGGATALPPGVRVFNKIGQAYGFLVDNAYVQDEAHGVEFLLSAALYVNADGVLNDDKYEYDTVGLPFLRELGRKVYEAAASGR